MFIYIYIYIYIYKYTYINNNIYWSYKSKDVTNT